jgi:hypothetical protein
MTDNSTLLKESRSLTSQAIVQEAPMKGLQSRLYNHFTTKAFLVFCSTFDTAIDNILPSFLSPTTSIPLHSLPCHFTDHSFSPDIY